MKLQATPVFERNWDLINQTREVTKKGKTVEERVWKILINEGSSRSSKTWSLFQVIFLWALYHKKKRIVVMRKTAVDCADVVESEFIDWLEDPLARGKQLERGEITEEEYEKFIEEEDLTQFIEHNKTKHTHTFPDSGSRIIFTGGDRVNKIIGKSNDVIWVNEPYDFPEEVLNQLVQRCNDFVLLDWNPKQAHFIERWKKRDNATVIHSTYKDNPFCPPEQKKHIESYLPLSNEFIETSIKDLHTLKNKHEEALLAILDKHGIKGAERSEIVRAHDNERQNTASAWHHNVYALGKKAERPNRIHKGWKKITMQEYHAIQVRPIYISDWGVIHPWGVLEMKYYDGVLYCHELNYQSENELKLSLTRTEQLQIDKSTDEGLVSWMFKKKLQIPTNRPVVCDNNRELKIRSLQTSGYDYAGKIRKYPGSIIDGINLVNSLPVCFTETSENLGYEYENYSRKVHKPTGEVLEDPEDKDDHLMNCIRYGAQHLMEVGVIRGK